MMWVFVGLASVELVVIHALVAWLWSSTLAAALSILTFGAVAWLVVVIASMQGRPVLLDGERLVMRVGLLKQVEVSVAQIAGLRRTWDRTALKEPGVLNLALIAWPNVLVDLTAPLRGRRRSIRSIAHRLDDPAAFAEAIDRLVARG